jgi:hypothetical protein
MALVAPPGAENPSPAFLAGQAHGARLAVQHHVAAAAPAKAPAKPVAAPTRPARAAAPPVNTLNSVLAQARAAAAADTNTQVAALKGQQALLNSQALARAQQINASSQAGAKYMAGLGDQTAASYNTAAATLAGIAGGYSGDLKSTATDAASQIQAQLAGLGAPADSLKTATGETPQPGAMANVLYGLGGAIPGNLLVTSGQAAAAAQRQLPGSTIAYGGQQAAAALQSGQTQAASLGPQILALRAGQPRLVQQYLTSIANQMDQQALAQSLIGSRATSGTVAQQRANAYGQSVTNAAGARTAAAGRPNSSLSKTYGYIVDSNGQPILGANGKPQPVKGGAGAPKPLSASALAKLSATANDLRYGVQPKYHFVSTGDPKLAAGTPGAQWQAVPGTGTPNASYSEAFTQLVADGGSIKWARAKVNALYKPGEFGRPPTAGSFNAAKSHPPAIGTTMKSGGSTYVYTAGGWVKH